MKNKSKFFVALLATTLSFSVASCALPGTNTGSTTSADSTSSVNEEIFLIYELAVKAGFEGTYDEWINTIRGEDGKGIVSITLSKSENGVDTYLVLFTDGTTTTFEIKNGVDGKPGDKGDKGDTGEKGDQGEKGDTGEKGDQGEKGDPGKDGQDGAPGKDGENGAPGQDGKDGVSIVGVDLTKHTKDEDIYTIRYSDGTTSSFKVIHGKDGAQGNQGETGEQGLPGIQGIPGKDGHTPTVTIGENGTWIIDGVDSKVPVTGEKGDTGENGKSAYEQYKEAHPEYTGDEKQWLDDLINGRLGIKAKHTVKFDSNGGTPVPDQTVLDCSKIIKPENPSKDYAEFDGWYYKNEKWSFVGYICTEDMTLQARWIESNIRKITLDYHIELIPNNEFIATIGEPFKLPVPVSEVPTKHFAGWYINNVQVTDSSGQGLKNFDFATDITLTPKFKENTYYVNEPTTITFWHNYNDDYASTLQTMVDSFSKKEPNVTVKLEKQMGNYDDIKDKIINGFNGLSYPDISVAYPDQVSEFLTLGRSVNLDKYMDNSVYGWTSEEKNDIVPAFLSSGQKYSIEGTYSLPFSKSTEAMFYNADVLLGLNLSVEDPTINGGQPLDEKYLNNLTWEELFNKLCPAIISYNNKLTDPEKILDVSNPNYCILGYDSDDNFFITLAKQYGIPYTDVDKTTGQGSILFNNPEMKNLMKTLNTAYKNKYLLTKYSNDGSYMNNLFIKKQSLFSIGSTGGTKYQYSPNFKTGVAKIPHAEGHDPAVIEQGPCLTMLRHNDLKQDNRELASWLFYKHLASFDNAMEWSFKTTYMPILTSIYESEEYLNYSNETNKIGVAALQARVAAYNPTVIYDLFDSVSFNGSSRCRVEVGALLSNCLVETNLTDQVLDTLFLDAENKVKIFLK